MQERISFFVTHCIVFVHRNSFGHALFLKIIDSLFSVSLSFLVHIADCCSNTNAGAKCLHESSICICIAYTYTYNSFLYMGTIFPTVFPHDGEYNRTGKNRDSEKNRSSYFCAGTNRIRNCSKI